MPSSHFFARFGQVGDEAGQRVDRRRQRLQPVLGAPGAETFQVAGVGLGRVRRPLQTRFDVAGRVLGEVGQREPLRRASDWSRDAFHVTYI